MFKIKRNKLNRQEAFNFEKRSRFGIRKLTIGVVSLVIGSGMVLNGVEQVYAGTDYEPGVEIRYARNGSPKALSSAGDFKIDTSPVEVFENGQVVHYVDVTLTFNEDGDNYTNRRFIGFNIPDSLYEPESITREIYYNAGGNQALKEKTTFSTWWHTQPSVGTTWWGTWPAYADARFIAGRPDLLSGDSYKKITGPDNAVKDTIGWQSEDKWNNQDWARLFSYFNTNGVDVRETVNRDFKDKSRTFYLNRYPASTDKFVYKFRARVKDGNAPMNFILGVNVDIANGHANFLAQYGTTPDTRTLADKSIINPSARHGVTKLEDLGSQTRNTIKQNIENANPDLFYGIHPLVTNVTVSTDGIGGNATLYFKDGSQKTIPMNQLVYKINNATGGTATASPVQTAFVNKGQGIAGYEMVGLANENHQLNLPAKKPVDSLINIENADLYLNKWNEQMTAFLGLNKTFQSWSNAWGFYNGARLYGTQNWKAEFLTAQIKYVEGSNNKRIQGIELSGPTKEYENVNIKPRNGVNTQVYGLLTPAMLFYQEDPLKTTKDEAKKTIDSIGNINGKSAEWKRRIDEAQSQQAIETIIAEARNEKNALDKKKEVAIKEINALPHLSNDEKTQAINAVTSATATTAIEQKLDEAKNLNKTNMRNKAKETINGLNKLNDDQKRPFLDRINSANTPEEIKAIIEEASFDNLKQNALDQLNNMDSAPSNKDELLQNLNNINRNDISSDGKTPAERIEAILESAKAEVLKDQAKRDINAISGLPEDKKNEFIRTVDNAQTPAEITNAVDQARAYSDYIKAKDAINKLTHLNDKQKEDLLARLEADKSQEGVTDTLATARSLDGDMKHLKDLEAQADQIKQSSDYSRADGTKQNDFDVALGAAKKVTPNGGELPTVPVSQLISDLTVAISGLDGSTQPITKDVDKANLKAEIDRSSQVKDPANAEYTYASDDKKQAYEQALTNANEVYNKTNPVATQAEVDEALGKLQAARIALDGHAPERVVDQTPPSELGGENLTNYSDVPIHGVSTIGKKIATPDTVATATVEDYGQNTTGLVEMIVVDNESAVSPASVEFTEESKNLMTMVGIKFVAYPEQKENKAIGYFTTIVPNGTLKETGAENLELKFTVANVDSARSNQFTFRYNMKDDIAPTVAETEHVLIKNQSYNISVPINDNSLFGTDGNIDKGSISIKINRDGELANAESRTPAVLGITNGENNNAWTVTPTNPQPFPNRGNRSNTGTLGFSGTATNTLTRTTYQLRVADSNKGHKMPENLSFANITFTVVDRLAAPAENAKVSVNNPSHLTEEEKTAIKQAVRTANPHIAAIDGNAGGVADKQVKIDVANNGQVTVTYPHGGKTDTLEAAQVLKENQAPVFGTNDFLPTLWVKDKEARLQEIPTLLVFSAPTANKTAPGFPSDRQNLSAEEVTNRKLGKLPFTDPEGQALTFDPIKTLDQATIGLNVSPNGTLYGNGIGNFGPGASWTVNLKATDSQGKSKTSSEFRVVGYTDKLKDANHVTGTYGQAITENAILDKLTIDATSGLPQNFVKPNDSSYTFTVPANQYTRTITGYKQTENGKVTTVNNGVAGLPKEGTYFAEVTTTNIWGQIIKNYVKVVYQDTLAARTDLVAPEAVQIKGTTVAEDEKQTIIDALKAANPGKLPEDTRYEVASNGAVTVIYNDNSREVVNVPLKSGLPTVTTQPHDLVVFKNTDMTTPVELAGFTDNESIKDVQIVSTDGRTVDEMGLTVGEKDKENNTKSALISGKTNLPVGGNARKLRALDNLDQPSAATNDFAVRIVDATVNQPETAIEKAFGQSLTPEDVRPKINFNVGSGQDNMIDFEVIIPGNAPTSGQNKDIPVTIRTKAHANASEDFKQTFVSQDKTVTVRATWPTQAAHIEVVPPANTAPVLIDSARPTTETDKTALINALKEANKTPEGTSKFPENTTFDVAEDGTVTITYPDRSSEQVTVPFKQKDSAQHTPVVTETPINSATTAGTELTEEERNAVKAAVTVPTYSGSGQPTVTVPADARVTNGTNGNTGKPVVVATVEYPDGTVETVEVPVRQRDTAKHDATVTNPDTPAAIKASHETGTQITEQDDKNAILAKVSVPTGSNGTPSLDQNPVVEEQGGKQVVKVTVTYPDQTTDTVYVPVDQKDNETHNPTAPAESVKLDAPATANSTLSDDDKIAIKAAVTVPANSGGQVSLPEGAKVELVNDKPVVKAMVTYPDGTTDIVDVPVVQKDSTKYDATAKATPVPLDSPVTLGQPLSPEEREAVTFGVNVPAGSNGQIHVPDNASVKLVGDKPVVEVEVRYSDGTVDKVQVPVRQYDRAVYTPNLVEAKEVPISVEPTNGTSITSPDDAAILANVDVPAATQDGTKPEVTKTIASPVKDGTGANQGKKVVEVEITYPDKSKETIEVPVKHADNQVHNPEAPAKPVQVDAPAVQDGTLSEDDKKAVKDAVTIPQGSGGVASLPEDAKVVDRNGTLVVPVTVTYPDGTIETVDVPVVQKDSKKHTPVLTDANSPVLTDTPAKANEPVQEEDKAAIAAKVDLSKLPENTTAKVPDGAKVELENGKPVVPVLVSYPDGTSETIKVPVDQKDSETYTPTAPAAETPVAITGSDAPDAPIAETDKPAILNSVTVPAVDGGQAPKVTKEITSPVKVVDGKAFVQVTVTYPDGTKDFVDVPVNQKDNEANDPTVPAPEKPAPISVPVAENTPVESDADKKLITDKVNVAGLPNPPQSVKVAEPAKVVMDQAGNPVVNVEVTYPDGTKDIVPVPVKQADNQTNTPSLKEPELGKPAEALVAIDPTPGVAITNQADKDAAVAKVDLSKLPAGTTAAVADGAVVANDPLTNKPVVPVTVTYPDGTSEIINVPVKQADNLALDPSLKDTNPVPILTEATVGLTVSDKANLDAIAAKVDPKTGKAEVVNNTIVAGKEDGPHAGQPVVNVLVTYPDGTQDTIEVPVKQADNVANEPSLTDQTPVPIQAAATTGTLVPADDKPAILAKVDLPAGAEATIADDATVVREDGQAVVPVTVTYPDGTTDTISVPVKRADNSKYTPSQVTDTVQVDAATAPGTAITSQDDKDAIIAAVTVPKVAAGEKAPVVSLPENTQVEVVNDQPVVKAIVTYADGTTDTVDVPIVQKVSATKEPSLKETEPGKSAQAVITEDPTAGKAITDPADQKAILDKVVVPEGGKASIADDAVVEMDGDQPVLPVTVTYTDGSKDIIKVPVKQADNVAKEPSLKNQTPVGVMDAPAVGAQVEESTDLEAIKNNVDTKGGTASIEDPTIVEGPNNQPAVAVTVTYPDGTTDTILVPIKTADNVTYTPVLKSTVPVLVSVATDNGTAVPGADQAKILANVDVPALTADGDKPAVALSIENPVVLQKNGQAGVEVTVTYQDGSKDKIFVPVDSDTDKDGFSNKEEEKAGTNATDPSSTPAGQDSAGRLNPSLAEQVEVKNPDKLSDAEKEAVKKAVEASNDLPAGTTVSVANDGTVTVTYPDNSTDTIQPKDAVTQFVDTDGDGISDRQETENGTDPSKVDSDNDGFSDKEEVERGTDPTKADSKPASSETDTDGDGISNEDEATRGTDPNKSDTDGDGFSDQEEITAGSNPTKADSTPANVDKDGDGFTDTEEAAAGTDANNPSSTPEGQDSAERLNPGLTEPVEVKNSDKLTDAEKEAVKKAVEDSNDLPAGTTVSVANDGTVTVTYPDKSTDTIQPAETVKVAKDTDKDGFTDTEEATAGTSATDPSSTPAGQDSAGQLTPSLAEPVEVKNPDKLTDAEKESVKKAVEDSNDLPEGTEVTVSDNGTVTVTYPDKSTDTIQPAETVKVAKDTDKDGFTDTEEEKAGTNATDPSSTPAGQDSAGQLTPSLTEPVEVKNPDKLTDAEKEAVKKAVEDSNDLPEGTEVTVSDNGTVTVTYPDKSADTIQPTDTVKAAKPVSETPVAPSKPEVTATDSGAVVVTPPTDNVTNLDITFTPEGASQPVTVVVSKDENGIWTAPADSGLVINSDGTITIPAEKVADGTAVTVVAENGSISSPEVGSTVVPVPAVTPETPVAPSKPEVTATDSGAVVVTPPTDNVTNLDITFTPEGSSQPVTVVVSKDATGTWTAPADSGLVVNPDGTITIPAENVADGTAVTVVAENGSVSSPEVDSAVVPVPTPELPAIPAKPTSVTNADGSVTIVPPVENVTGLDITFTPEGATEPVTVTLGKDATGAWTAPADSGLVVNPDGTITIPADRLADGTEGQVGLVAKNGDLTSNDPAPQVPETPAKSSVETNENGSVTIVPPVENVTGIDITFTPEGASQPVTVVVSKDATGAWTAPADSGLVVNPDGTITIPADKVADGTAVSVVTKNGQVPSDEASATYVPAKPASTDTPVVEVPATPSLALDGSGNVLITPPAENATSLDITFTPAGSETPITVTANKDATGNWILPETSIAVVNPDGTISISTSEMEGGTAVSVVAKNEGVPSSQAATLLVQPKQTAEELAPTVKKPIAVEDASKLTDAEKKELEDVVRKDNVLPEGTEVSVADDGTVTVTYPDKSTDTILPTKTVMDAQNGKGTSHSLPAYDLTADEDKDGFTNEEELKQGSNVADAKSVPAGKSSAERLTPTNDLAVKVKDLTKLSDAEKETVETAIRKDKDLPEGTQIEVANDGSVTITYPDGSIGRLPADQTVLQVAHGEGTSHSLPAYDLTADEDKDGFTNEEELKQGSNVADAKSVPAGKSSAERLTPTNDLAVKVKDLTKLTDAEKKAVETAIRKNNTLPEGTQIEVANDGSVTITYPDGSVDQIVATKVVATDSTVSPDSGVSQSSGTTKVLPGSASATRAAKKPLPATGENGSPILVLSGLALLAGVAMFRKAKREDEN
ncbi:TPA: GA module-containing protein [Streptococcus suis]|uniref:Rib/alpha-like domain-containing protein n=2 Tax=Streptococcus suis TaxID=1307 RepID=UPI001552D9CF|nr:Rib/alpha-like domain-containing protein [Streptococcus suis]NQR42949.1 YSIRK-type signal peptide-containing protein [Streptococcus suis]WNF77176.1 Rib/alpha-like domain-containing protein [Streptococcus suis]HEM5659960.1 GA module-containing protein [Streptococcus suis]